MRHIRNNCKPVMLYNKAGDQHRFDSKSEAARFLGVSLTTFNTRMKDHHPILIPGAKGIYIKELARP